MPHTNIPVEDHNKNSSRTNSELSGDELVSDEIRDIITYQPHWIIRWGITIMALVISGMLLVSWFIQYPDVVTSQLYLIPN